MLPEHLPDFRLLRHRFFPHGYLDAVWQVALFLIVYYAYRLVRGAVDGKTAESFQHGPRRIDEIRTLVDTDLAAGLHQLQWDLTDAQGTRVPPGIYRAVLRVGEHSLCGDIEAR